MLRLISIYSRWISPFLPPHCRYYPSCSQYASEAVSTHGAIKGGWMGVKRICRCNPFSLGGFDPVPGKCGCDDAERSPVECGPAERSPVVSQEPQH